MNKDASISELCNWICERESKSIADSKGVITEDGKIFIELLEKNPSKILDAIKRTNQSKIRLFIMETNQSVFVADYDKLCEDVFEGLKKRFTPLSS